MIFFFGHFREVVMGFIWRVHLCHGCGKCWREKVEGRRICVTIGTEKVKEKERERVGFCFLENYSQSFSNLI